MADVEDEVKSSFTCSICLEMLQVPKTLHCLHSFCAHCLQCNVNRMATFVTKSIKCPNCRQDTPVPDPSKPVTEWVSQLRTNYTIEGVVEKMKKPIRPDCDICKADERNVETCSYCRTCDVTFCKRCDLVHKKIPSCQNHDVEKAAAKDETTSFEFNIHLDASSSERGRRALWNKVKQEVENKVGILKLEAMKLLDKNVQVFQENTDVIVDDMFRRFSIQYPVEGLDDSTDVENKKFLMVMTIVSQVEAGGHAVGKLEISDDFSPDSDPNGLSQSHANSRKKEVVHILLEDELSSADEGSDFTEESSDDEELTPVRETSFQSNLDSDEQIAWIRNIISMNVDDVETIIVTDFNNSCVKSFYGNEDIADFVFNKVLSVAGRPWGICALANERIAVTCPEEKLLYIIRVGPPLKTLQKIKTKSVLFGVVQLKVGMLLASAPKEHPPSLHVMDVSGQILKTVSKHTQGRCMFSSPDYIARSSTGLIFVADPREKRVLVMTRDWKPIDSYTAEKYGFSSMLGIACDVKGHVYVVDRDRNSVICLKERVQVVLSKDSGIDYPRCLCFTKDALFLAEENGLITKFSLA